MKEFGSFGMERIGHIKQCQLIMTFSLDIFLHLIQLHHHLWLISYIAIIGTFFPIKTIYVHWNQLPFVIRLPTLLMNKISIPFAYFINLLHTHTHLHWPIFFIMSEPLYFTISIVIGSYYWFKCSSSFGRLSSKLKHEYPHTHTFEKILVISLVDEVWFSFNCQYS